MAWNGSGSESEGGVPFADMTRAPRPAWRRGASAGLTIVGLGAAALYFLVIAPGKTTAARGDAESPNAKGKATARVEMPHSRTEVIREVKSELNAKVQPFIRRADTNHAVRLGTTQLDPADPDNALRTQTMTEVAMLVGIEPGDPMPPVPFSFMQEDMALESATRDGSAMVESDGGNRQFMEELEKWKITVKDTDSEARAAKKRELLASQLELVKGIEEGLSVNDTIRSAYDFRVKAYEARRNLLTAISEMHASDPDAATTRALIKTANAKLAEEGIKAIADEEVITGYEDAEQPEQQE